MIEFEHPKCNLCGNKNNKTFLSGITSWEYKGIFDIVKCKNCGLIYLSPRPKKTSISKFYSKVGYWNIEKDKNWKKTRENNYNFLYKLIFKKIKKGSILDVGSGNGMFLSKFKEDGWIVKGIEFSSFAANFSKKEFDIDTFHGDLLDFKSGQKYDVITFNNSLEHLYFPFESLKKAHELLTQDGVVIITVPNIESLGFKIFRKGWYPLQVPRHLVHFSVKTSTKILRKSGFRNFNVHHGYYEHNYYSFFETFRFMFSPRFKKEEKGGLMVGNAAKPKKNTIKEVGKIIDKVLSPCLAVLGSILKKGETITIIAAK